MKRKNNLYFITGNSKKFKEVKALLPSIMQLNLDLPEIQELDPKKIIQAKLLEAVKHKKGSFIVEDTSLYIKSLKGLPGPLIKWFMQSLGNKGIAELALKNKNTEALAVTYIGYIDSTGHIEFFSGSLRGKIVKPHGKNTFGWDPIFLPKGKNMTLAQMSLIEKNKLSMRKKAFTKLIKHLKSATNN